MHKQYAKHKQTLADIPEESEDLVLSEHITEVQEPVLSDMFIDFPKRSSSSVKRSLNFDNLDEPWTNKRTQKPNWANFPPKDPFCKTWKGTKTDPKVHKADESETELLMFGQTSISFGTVTYVPTNSVVKFLAPHQQLQVQVKEKDTCS